MAEIYRMVSPSLHAIKNDPDMSAQERDKLKVMNDRINLLSGDLIWKDQAQSTRARKRKELYRLLVRWEREYK